MSYDDELEQRISALEDEVAELKQKPSLVSRGQVCVRRRSETIVLGLPLWEIAQGPDPEKGETRGHAKAIIAIGDMATGVVAVGGFARGVIALGGLAIGVVSFGGAAVGALLAFGGAALARVAFGGFACGYYAVGGGTIGQYVIDGAKQDPEAVQFFQKWLPGLWPGQQPAGPVPNN